MRQGQSALTRTFLGLGALAALASYSVPASAMQTCTTGPFVKGVDVYHGDGTIDWATAKGAGIDFAVIKASQGTYDTDANFASNWANAKAAGVLRSPYHFLDPTESGVTQAQFFLGIVGTLSSTDLPPVLDIECPTSNNATDNCLGTGASGAASGSAITTVMNDWLTTVKAATGKTPVVYSFGSYFTDDNIDTTGLQNYPLYIAYPTTSSCFNFPGPWTKATFWQYDQMGTIAGIGSGVDVDYFLGTMAELTAFAASGVAPQDAGASSGPDGGTPCVVTTTGESGECMLTSACMALGNHTSTPGYCPGAADIECCTSNGVPDAGKTSGMDAAGGGSKDATVGGGHDSGSIGTPDSSVIAKRDAGADATDIGRGMGGHAADGGGGVAVSNGGGGCTATGRDAKGSNGLWTVALVLGGILVRRRRAPR